MASKIPPVMNPKTKSPAEIRLFERFKTELSGDWVVIHSMDLGNVPGKVWGEIDFVLIGPPGVFSIEVKGGRVGYDSSTGKWMFTNRRDETTYSYEGPYDQVNAAHHGLMNYIRGQLIDEFLPIFGFGVMIPDIDFNVNRPEIVREVLYDGNNSQESLSSYVNRLGNYWKSKFPRRPIATEVTRERILQRLRGDLELIPSVSVTVQNVKQELIKFTYEQELIVKGLRDSKRALIKGGAGTGKSICAISVARSLADKGKKVLFTCFNRRLSKHLDASVEVEGLEITNIHSLMSTLIRDSGATFPTICSPSDWEDKVPNLAFDAIADHGYSEKYDALIIDEAQDLNSRDYFDMVLDPLLKDGLKEGSWRIFMDEKQDIFGSVTDEVKLLFESFTCSTYSLTMNCRNTKQISDHTAILSGSVLDQVCKADGPVASMNFYRDEKEAIRQLSREINKLLSRGITPDQIAVLSPKLLGNSLLRDGLVECAYKLTDPKADQFLADRQIGCYTIQSFKGLESDVVILVDMDDFGQMVN